MKLISVDVEADGPCAGLYSMICFGAVVVEPKLNRTFYGQLHPIAPSYIKENLAVTGFTYDDVLKFPDPRKTMREFHEWIKKLEEDAVVFISDNPAFDWQFINYYFWHYCNENPFGHSARRIGDIYCGLMNNLKISSRWKKKFRKTKHTHNPLDDAMGNAEAILGISKAYGLSLT